MAVCGKDKKNCKCGYRYGKNDQKGPQAVCPQCGAPRPCERAAMANGCCEVHGGKSRKGMDHPGFKTGSFSAYLPKGMLELFEAALADETLLESREDVALLKVRVMQLLKSGESEPLWRYVRDAWSEFIQANKVGDKDAVKIVIRRLDQLIQRGYEDSLRWQEIYAVEHQITRTKESERRRLAEAQQMITAEEAMVFVSVLINSVRSHVLNECDAKTAGRLLSRISNDLVATLGPGRGSKVVGNGSAETALQSG